jgi:hypothetical protein
LVINIYINLVYAIYIAQANPFKEKNLNQIDLFNEIVVSATLYWKILYSGLINDEDDKTMYAKMESGFILLYCFINLIIIL